MYELVFTETILVLGCYKRGQAIYMIARLPLGTSPGPFFCIFFFVIRHAYIYTYIVTAILILGKEEGENFEQGEGGLES